MTQPRRAKAIPIFPSPGRAKAVVALAVLLMVIANCSGGSTASHRPAQHGGGVGGAEARSRLGQEASASIANASDWLRFNNDPAHSGSVAAVGLVSAATVGRLRQVMRVALGGVADSAPVYLHGLVFPDRSVHDVLYVNLRTGTLVALDAGTGHALWRVATHGPEWTTSAPAADPSHRDVYFYGLDGFVHKVGAIDGMEVKTGGWPVRITTMPQHEKGSSPLDIVNGRLYASLATYAPEVPPNDGHLVVIDLANASTHVFNTMCSNIPHLLVPQECAASGGGVWARATPVIDPVTGNLFIATANGPFDGHTNWGDSVLELNADATHVVDSYTPVDQKMLDDMNWDLGSTAPALLPKIADSTTPYLMVQGGKDGVVRLLNRQNLSGQGGPGHLGGEVQVIANPGCTMFTQPAVWQESAQGAPWVFTSDTCGMTGYQAVTDQKGNTSLRQEWHLPVVTSSPLLAGEVLFAASNGALLALDPRSGQQLWSSARPSALGTLGGVHWESPIIVEGKVYVTDESGALVTYGLP